MNWNWKMCFIHRTHSTLRSSIVHHAWFIDVFEWSILIGATTRKKTKNARTKMWHLIRILSVVTSWRKVCISSVILAVDWQIDISTDGYLLFIRLMTFFTDHDQNIKYQYKISHLKAVKQEQSVRFRTLIHVLLFAHIERSAWARIIFVSIILIINAHLSIDDT